MSKTHSKCIIRIFRLAPNLRSQKHEMTDSMESEADINAVFFVPSGIGMFHRHANTACTVGLLRQLPNHNDTKLKIKMKLSSTTDIAPFILIQTGHDFHCGELSYFLKYKI